MTDIEILQSLPSLYPLQDYEEEAIDNVCNTLKADEDELSQSIKDFNYGVLNGFQAERPCGRWISSKRVGFGKWEDCEVKLNELGEVSDSCHCSECGEYLIGSDEYACIGKYCPNCGARMEGAE